MPGISFSRSGMIIATLLLALCACSPKGNNSEIEKLRSTLDTISGSGKKLTSKTNSKRQLQRDDERSHNAPLYQDIAEYYCTNGNNEGDFFAYNTNTGREVARSNTDNTTKEIREWASYEGSDVKRSHMSISDGNWVHEIEYTDEPGTTYIHKFNPESETFTGTTIKKGKIVDTYTDACISAALPFKPTGKSFEKHLNTSPEWQKGKEITFSYLDNCRDHADFMLNPSKTTRRFFCKHGYVAIKSPLGSEVCELGRKTDSNLTGVIYEINFKQQGKRLSRTVNYSFGKGMCKVKS